MHLLVCCLHISEKLIRLPSLSNLYYFHKCRLLWKATKLLHKWFVLLPEAIADKRV